VPTRGRFHLKLRRCPLTLSPTRRPNKTPLLHQKRVVIGRKAALRFRLRHCLKPASKNQVEPRSGRRHGGDFTSNLATALGLSLLPATNPRPRGSTKTSRHRPYDSATVPPSSYRQESGSSQLGVPTRGRFHLKPSHFPLTLSPSHRPPKTPLLHQNESSLDVRQRYGSVFVRA
jgi:hypothetical protein